MPVALPFPAEQRFLMDWCLQISFEIPANVSNSIIWPESDGDDTVQHPFNKREIDISESYQQQVKASNSQMHPYDWTAAELYTALEELLIR